MSNMNHHFKKYDGGAVHVTTKTVTLHDGTEREVRCYLTPMEYSGDLSPRGWGPRTRLHLWYNERYGRYTAVNCDEKQEQNHEHAYAYFVWDECEEGEDGNPAPYPGVPSYTPELMIVRGREYGDDRVVFEVTAPTGDIEEDFARADYLGFIWMDGAEGEGLTAEQQREIMEQDLLIYGYWLMGSVYELVVVDSTGEVHDVVCDFYWGLSKENDDYVRQEGADLLNDVVARLPNEYLTAAENTACRELAGLLGRLDESERGAEMERLRLKAEATLAARLEAQVYEQQQQR